MTEFETIQSQPNSTPSMTIDQDSLLDIFEGDQPELTAMILHQAATICFTLLGNLLMIFVIFRHNDVKKRKKVTPVQMLMLHMCTSDIMYALITVFPTMLITITVPVFYGPDWLCKVVKFLQVLPMYSSSFLLVAISADRYYAICRPLEAMMSTSQYSRSTKYALSAWIFAIILSTPQFWLFSKNEYGDCIVEYHEPWQYPVYVIYFNVVVWLLPSVIAGILYYKVCRAMWQSLAYNKNYSISSTKSSMSSSKSLRKTFINSEKNTKNNFIISKKISAPIISNPIFLPDSSLSEKSLLYHTFSNKSAEKNNLDQKRAGTVKLTLTIVAANFVLWAPFCIISVIDALMPYFLSPVVATYIMFFGNLNSCMNPWIWFYFNKSTVRTVFSDIINCITKRKNKEKLTRSVTNVGYSTIEMAILSRGSESF